MLGGMENLGLEVGVEFPDTIQKQCRVREGVHDMVGKMTLQTRSHGDGIVKPRLQNLHQSGSDTVMQNSVR